MTNNSNSLIVKKINSDDYEFEKIINQGTFLIPFTGNDIFDNKIIAVIYDYNISNEINKNTVIPVESYMILEPLKIDNLYKLNEPKIAYYYGDGVYSRSLNWYVDTLYKSGFLTNDFLYDEEIIEDLN